MSRRTAALFAVAFITWVAVSFVLTSSADWVVLCDAAGLRHREMLAALYLCTPRLLTAGPAEAALAFDLWSPVLLAAFLLRPRRTARAAIFSSDPE